MTASYASILQISAICERSLACALFNKSYMDDKFQPINNGMAIELFTENYRACVY